MLSNPPYGKSWASEQKNIKDNGEIIDPRFKVELKDYWGKKETADATPRSSDGQLLFLMEMVSKMKSPEVSPLGSRIASVHNGSSLFTGDAGGGESNIRRYIIENDMLDAIVQLPNNLFYNTGITTYIWLLNNKKPANRRGKVQLIDASLLYRKLRKNLGNKNCEFAPEHIEEITRTYLGCAAIERKLDENNDPFGIASQVFDNSDFGYYKVTIERPDRRKAKFTPEAIAPLRFDKSLTEVMEHIYAVHGDTVYEKGYLKANDKAILQWCEDNDISINAKAKAKLLDEKYWQKLRDMLEAATLLMAEIGSEEFNDFNLFKDKVDAVLKPSKFKLTGPEKNAILNAVSWYDESAEKVVKKVVKLSGSKLDELLEHLGCSKEQLPDYGYYPTGKAAEYITYEASTDLRDAESIPLKDSIYRYFLAEVKPHVDEAWINLDSTKIGYEISFNKYFYQHKPLRSLEQVAIDIIGLEQKAEGLIAQILGVDVAEVQGDAQ
jgi:type I restriction enzyme M protein